MLESSPPRVHAAPMLAVKELVANGKLKHEKYEVVKPDIPSKDFKLGPFDKNMPFLWFSLLQVFENTRGDGEFMNYKMMRDSLELALEKLPIFAGTPVCGAEPYVSGGKGAWLCEEKTDIEFLEFKPKMSYELLPASFCFLAKVDAILKEEDAPVFSAKLNRFQCGSVALVVMLHHYVGDGSTLSIFMDVWGRLAQNTSIDASVGDSRLSLAEIPETPSFKRKERPATKALADPGDNVMLRVSIPIANLKTMQSEFKGYVSTDDIFTAAVWRAKVRSCPSMENSCLVRAINIRNLVTPPQPTLTIGNFAEGLISGPVPLSKMLDMPLQQTASLLRQDLQAFDHNYVASLQAYFHHQPRLTGLLANFTPRCDFICSSHARFYTKTDFNQACAIFSKATTALDSNMIISPPYQGNHIGYFYLKSDQADCLVQDPELEAIGFTITKVPPSSFE